MYKEWRDIKLGREHEIRTERETSFLKQEKKEGDRRKFVGNRSNKSSAAYDIITLQYHDGYDGDKLTYDDKAKK